MLRVGLGIFTFYSLDDGRAGRNRGEIGSAETMSSSSRV